MERLNYNKVSLNIVNEIREIAGYNNVIFEDKEKLENYACDESGEFYFHMPEVVVKVKSAQEISKIMQLANRENIPITPRGAGSGIAGSAVPLYGGIVISLENMNKIIEIDNINMLVVSESGVITNDICKAVADKGLFYAGYPMSVESSFIGGNVATNAGGGTVIKYGNTGHHVLGLEVVLPTGEILELGGKRRKDTNGYNLVQFIVQSEGTLGIITKVILNLLPLPGKRVNLLVAFPKIETAVIAVPNIITKAKTLPVSVELMDKLTVEITSKYLNTKLPAQDTAGSYLLLQMEALTEEDVEMLYETVGEICLDGGAIEVFVLDTPSKSENIWKFRMNVLEAFKSVNPYVAGEEVVVPISKISQMCNKISEIAKKYKITCPICGHVGDGNLHMGVMKPSNVDPKEWPKIIDKIMVDVYIEAKKMGGSVSGEHAIGISKKKFLALVKNKEELDLMRRIKEAFDPKFILNPGKIF